ncbi:MAG TPA: cytochrome c3 family protein, partial [Planctomycetota bacterium]|nr:cytochrome c3 family protein [Planctomycetota bacterium]
MAFLSPADETERHARPSGRQHGRAWALVLAIAAAGCALFNTLDGAGRQSGFRHALHGPDTGLECENCHRTAQRDEQPGMPVLSQCLLCHDTIDKEKPPERRASALFDDGKLRRLPREYLADEILFSHENHAPSTQCTVCHEGIERDAPQPLPRMSDCVACHKEQRAANECATCHRDLRTDRAPPSHAFGWQRSHGLVVRAHDTATVNDCSMCHQESGCSKCHREVPPANHDNYFRLRGHGLMARMDR